MTSRERFEAWVATRASEVPANITPWTAWQAAEREAVRACYDIARGWVEGSKIGADIRQEFPEAFK